MRTALRWMVCALAAAALHVRAADEPPAGGSKANPEVAAVPSDGSMAGDEELGGGSGEPARARARFVPSDGSMAGDEELGGGSGEAAPAVLENIGTDRG